jgi:hypothetical protein
MDDLKYGSAEMLTTDGVGRALNVPAASVIDAAIDGEIPSPVWIGGQPRWPRLRLLKWLQNNCPQQLKSKPIDQCSWPEEQQPGDREAAGAIAGMQEIYGAPAEPVTEGIPMDLLVIDPTDME